MAKNIYNHYNWKRNTAVPDVKSVYKVADRAGGLNYMIKKCSTAPAKESGICQELFETHDEKPTNSFLLFSGDGIPILSGILPEATPICRSIIRCSWRSLMRSRKLRKKGPCILVGRCADYALENYDNVLSILCSCQSGCRESAGLPVSTT